MPTTALLILDIINDLEFPEGDRLLEQTLPILQPLQQLRAWFHERDLPVIYCNDNFGRWQSNLEALVKHVLEDGVRGQPLAEALKPTPADYFVLKPRHSGFFSTTLETLLYYLRVDRLVITGVAADICVLFTVHDAHMRDFPISVPRDCVASNTADRSRRVLQHMEEVLSVDTRPWREQAAQINWRAR